MIFCSSLPYLWDRNIFISELIPIYPKIPVNNGHECHVPCSLLYHTTSTGSYDLGAETRISESWLGTMQQPQPLASTSQLVSTPSAKDGLPKQVEDDLRVAGCMMIQEAGVMLGL